MTIKNSQHFLLFASWYKFQACCFLVPEFVSDSEWDRCFSPIIHPWCFEGCCEPRYGLHSSTYFWALNAKQRSRDVGVIGLPQEGREALHTARVFSWCCPSGWARRGQHVLNGNPVLGGALWYLVLKHWIWNKELLVSGLPLTIVCVLLHGLLSCKWWGSWLDKAARRNL